MALDDINDNKKIKSKSSILKKYKQFKDGEKELKKNSGDTFEQKKSDITTQLSEAKKLKNKYQKELKSQFDEMLDLIFITNNNGSQTKSYLKRTFVTALNELKPKVFELLTETSIQAIGCSEDQLYQNQTVYVKVSNIDFNKLLQEPYDTLIGSISYESKDITYGNTPFSMNKELYERTQQINQPFSVSSGSPYKGTSGQDLFDITYVESYPDPVTGNIIVGNFYKIELKNRATVNKVSEFLNDYYSTIELIDLKNFFANVMNQLSGAISIKKGNGKIDLGEFEKFLLLIKRLLGLCYDPNTEIDVSGPSKVSSTDNIDESFWEFTDIDLRMIDQKVSDIKLGVVEFDDCFNVKLPVDSDSIINAISNLNFIEDENNSIPIDEASNLPQVLTSNPGWFPLEIDVDTEFLKEFPKAMVTTVLSPKVLLPIMTMIKALGQSFNDQISSFTEFAKNFKKFFTELVTKIGALFIKILFDIIKKDLKSLIKSITTDILKEKTNKKLTIILSLSELLVSIANLLQTTDYRECKNVIQELLNLLDLSSKVFKAFGNTIPLPLLLASKLLSGFSATRAFVNVVDELDKLGIPTGPMPDGSPNKFVASIKAVIDGIDKEESENGQVQIALSPLSVNPINQTDPLILYGKKI
jgi:hypothetical protein